MSKFLLDTCAVIWTGNGQEISTKAVKALDDSYNQSAPIFVSPYTAWELGVLVSRSRIRLPQAANDWFKNYVSQSGSTLAELSPDILVASSFLPANPPSDPADRIIIATAREYAMTIITRDKKILDYAKQGHVMALAC